VIDTLAEALQDAVSDPAVAEQLSQNGAEPNPMGPGELRDLIEVELELYREIVDSMN
jgi:tripartite-type tricarboxylate transporter receptor subunit TctC